jgi:two-component system, chemotaxis family, protein-glutamate methylesterase/glutaminase
LDHHDVVAIGTSAGGVEALIHLAGRLSRDFPAAVLITLHLPKAGRSELDQLLSRSGPLPARFAQPEDLLVNGRIFIAPPDHHLLVEGDRLNLGRGPPENNSRPAIDPMFRSIALCCGERAIGVVLTGTLGDGASGLGSLKALGGQTVVQDPKDAAYAEMPFNAMNHVMPHHVVALGDLPRLLNQLVRLPRAAKVAAPPSLAAEVATARGQESSIEVLDQIGTRSVLACPECHGVMWEISDGGASHYRCHVGHAFGDEMLDVLLDANLKGALASAQRVLEERHALIRKLERQASANGHRLLVENWAARAKQVQSELAVLRATIKRLDELSSSAGAG